MSRTFSLSTPPIGFARWFFKFESSGWSSNQRRTIVTFTPSISARNTLSAERNHLLNITAFRGFSSRYKSTPQSSITRGKKNLTNSNNSDNGGNNNGNNSSQSPVSQLFVPVPVKIEPEFGSEVGVELTGKLKKQDVLRVLNKFFRRSEIKLLSLEHGLDSKFDFWNII